MFNKHEIERNACQLFGKQAKCGYDWWWHSFTAYNEKSNKEKSFFIEFFLCNPELGREVPVFGQIEKNKKQGIKPSYLMIKVGAWGEDAAQLHQFFGWKKIDVSMETPFHIKVEDFYLDENSTKGSIMLTDDMVYNHPEYMSQSGSMSWNLKINKKVAFNVGYGASRLFRKLQVFDMFWHAEGMKTEYEGEVIWNGETYQVTPELSYGYADKNWGKDFTSPWVWLSSNNLTSTVTGKKE